MIKDHLEKLDLVMFRAEDSLKDFENGEFSASGIGLYAPMMDPRD